MLKSEDTNMLTPLHRRLTQGKESSGGAIKPSLICSFHISFWICYHVLADNSDNSIMGVWFPTPPPRFPPPKFWFGKWQLILRFFSRNLSLEKNLSILGLWLKFRGIFTFCTNSLQICLFSKNTCVRFCKNTFVRFCKT